MTKRELQEKVLPRQLPFVIGISGPIASGKSTVAALLREKGAYVIDADHIYRSLLVPRSNLWHQLVERFGPTIVRSDGEIDRAALGELVFRDRAALADLDGITHPAVVAKIRTELSQSTSPVVVIEAVKLVQSGLSSDVDALWFVAADPETRLVRLMSRPGMDEAKARARIDAAPSAVPDETHVDVTIDNSGDLAATALAVDEAWHAMKSVPEKKRRAERESTQEEHS
jgi:dephospho-CoA kinase